VGERERGVHEERNTGIANIGESPSWNGKDNLAAGIKISGNSRAIASNVSGIWRIMITQVQ